MSQPKAGRGVLPVNAAQTKKHVKPKPAPREPAPRTRLILRRLPPGIIEAELWDALGDEWKVSKGKVDWAAFRAGKVSRDPSKPSRPARAYLRVRDPADLDALAAKVKSTTFADIKRTGGDSCLVGPPILEFAPYNKVPSGRVKHDGRQGTIDQDPEFIEFLQSLTAPITKATVSGDDTKLARPTTTPLIQYLKEKKANKTKEKDTNASKTPKKGQDKQDTKAAVTTAAKENVSTLAGKKGTSAEEKARLAKATQDAVSKIKGSVAAMQAKTTVPPPVAEEKSVEAATPLPVQSSSASQSGSTRRERARGNANTAAAIIGRDLGLAPKKGDARRATLAQNRAQAATNASTAPSTPTVATTVTDGTVTAENVSNPQPAASAQPPTAPKNMRGNNIQGQATSKKTTKPQQPPAGSKQQQPPVQQAPKPHIQPPRPTHPRSIPTPGATQAFLKHANPSQGVTEDLLRSTFGVYGELTRCEIDKKKGLAYIDFAQHNALKLAMQASPIKIANANVQVLENKAPHNRQRPGTAMSTNSVNGGSQAQPTPVVQPPKADLSTSATTQGNTKDESATITSWSEEVEDAQAAIKSDVSKPAPLTSATEVAAAMAAANVNLSAASLATAADPAAASNTAPPPAPRAQNARGGRANFRGHRGNSRAGRGNFRGGSRQASNAAGATASSSPANTPAPSAPAAQGS